MLLLLFVLAIVIPYLWILPIHAIGSFFKSRSSVFPETIFRWTLRHFWMACSLWLTVEILAILLFEYEVILSYFGNGIGADETNPISKSAANMGLFFSTGILLITLSFVRKEDVTRFYYNFKANKSSIWLGLGLALLLRFGLGLYLAVLNLSGFSYTPEAAFILSVNESIQSINQFYHPALGFLFVAILVPVYEEILFRGLILSGCERYMKFMYANIFQSLLFAILHEDWKLLPFFFAFGMLAGYYRHRRQSLVIGTTMHIWNNMIAFLAILLRTH